MFICDTDNTKNIDNLGHDYFRRCYKTLNYEMQFPLKNKTKPKSACQRRVWNFPAISDNHFANKQLKNLISQQTVDIIGQISVH